MLARGLSQQNLADKTGLTVRCISRLEDTAPNLTFEVIERLLERLGCTFTDLGGKDDSARSTPSMKQALDEAIQFLQEFRSRL